jgi:hypothetical protein
MNAISTVLLAEPADDIARVGVDHRVATFDPLDPTSNLGLPRGAQLDRLQGPSEILDQLLAWICACAWAT